MPRKKPLPRPRKLPAFSKDQLFELDVWLHELEFETTKGVNQLKAACKINPTDWVQANFDYYRNARSMVKRIRAALKQEIDKALRDETSGEPNPARPASCGQ